MSETPKALPETPTLESERLILRPIRMDDAPALQRRFPKWEIVRLMNHRIPWPYPPDGAATHLAEFLPQMQRRESFAWAITLKGGPDELIGRIDLRPGDGASDQRGFWLDTEFWGRGLMTEAAERVTEFAFVELGWPELILSNAEANLASHRIKEKQGARIIARSPARYVSGEGVKVQWRLRREDWLARRGISDGGGGRRR